MQDSSVKSGWCPDGVYGRIVAQLNVTGRAESSKPARRPGKARSAPPVFDDRVPDAQPLHRSAACGAPLGHPPCTIARRLSTLLFPAIPPTDIPCPASRGRPRTAVETCLVARDAPANSTGSSLPPPVGWARLRKPAAGRNGRSSGRNHALRKAPTSCPALGQGDSFTDALTADWALSGVVPNERRSRTLAPLGTGTTPLPPGALATRRPRPRRSFAGRGARRVAAKALAGTRCQVDTAGGNGGARRCSLGSALSPRRSNWLVASDDRSSPMSGKTADEAARGWKPRPSLIQPWRQRSPSGSFRSRSISCAIPGTGFAHSESSGLRRSSFSTGAEPSATRVRTSCQQISSSTSSTSARGT